MLGRLFAQMGHYYAWASPDYLLDCMTIDQVFHYAEMMIWNETGDPPKSIAEQIDKNERWKAYPELAPTPGGDPRVITR